MRPWANRTKELKEKHGPWADYAAWEEWFARLDDDLPEGTEIIADVLDYTQMAFLYSWMYDLTGDGSEEDVDALGAGG